MNAQLNHTIVWSRDQAASAQFLSDIFGLAAPSKFAHFHVVKTENGVSLDFADKDGPIASQHYAFLVTEDAFDGIMARIEARALTYWADPAREKAGQINYHDGGRGVYFKNPDGHLLEAITRPYGSGAAS